MSDINLAIEILKLTNDGNDLDFFDLLLVEIAVNGVLSKSEKSLFENLFNRVKKGYTKPYLHKIKNLIINNRGDVFWKNHQVEHYDIPWAYTDDGKNYAIELANRCKVIESKGKLPTVKTVIWNWSDAQEEKEN